MRTLCLIPARGGSVRIPRKNIKWFHGKPIILYSIETARASFLFDDILVSTDDAEVMAIARDAGVSVHLRGYDDGSKGTQEVAADVLRDCSAGVACVLYATAPLLQPGHLIVGYQRLLQSGVRFTYSVDGKGNDIGGFYWGFARYFMDGYSLDDRDRALRVLMHPKYCCDINTPEDWTRAEEMYAAIHR